jgi:hypothetical protein
MFNNGHTTQQRDLVEVLKLHPKHRCLSGVQVKQNHNTKHDLLNEQEVSSYKMNNLLTNNSRYTLVRLLLTQQTYIYTDEFYVLRSVHHGSSCE